MGIFSDDTLRDEVRDVLTSMQYAIRIEAACGSAPQYLDLLREWSSRLRRALDPNAPARGGE